MIALSRYVVLLTLALLSASADASEGRAVSLKVLQSLMAKGTCPQEARQLCGMTRITGYVADKKAGDLILIGESEPDQPPLHLDDFVVALRNATLQYAELKGRTYYYSSPGCSIDPDPKVIRQLQQVGDSLGSAANPEETQRVLDEWDRVGKQPQTVRVLGVPFDTRFAKVMVDADYYMKRLVNGSVTLDIPGFTSVTDMSMEIARADLRAGRQSSARRSMNRFWFCPGQNTYREEDGVVLLDACQVKLLTEQEFLSTGGQIRGTGGVDSLAKRFADGFTANYQKIAEQRPIYKELEGLFRLASLAKLITDKRAATEAGAKLDYVKGQYKVAKTPVVRTVPGLTNCKGFTEERRYEGGIATSYMYFPSCGGVSMDFHPKLVKTPTPKAPVQRPSGGKTSSASTAGNRPGPAGSVVAQPSAHPSTLRKTVLAARSSAGALSWSY